MATGIMDAGASLLGGGWALCWATCLPGGWSSDERGLYISLWWPGIWRGGAMTGAVSIWSAHDMLVLISGSMTMLFSMSTLSQ